MSVNDNRPSNFAIIKPMKYFFLISYIFIFQTIKASEKSEAFLIYAHQEYFKVLSPTNSSQNISVIIENKTLTNLIGKIRDDQGKNHVFLSIPPNETKSYLINNFSSYKSLAFYPLSPPFQEIVLKPGLKSYEIPSQK